jgi:hypothetical protein
MAVFAGCSGGPEPVRPPEWDPPEQAEQAMAEIDTNGDGLLDAGELAKAPGLAAGIKYIDQNADGNISEAEIEARIEQFRVSSTAARSRMFHLTYRGRPLAEAKVRFTPEPFLDGVIEPAEGVADGTGTVMPFADIAEGVKGIRPGYYRVEVTSPHVQLPAKFNSETTLGAEVPLPTDPGETYGAFEMALAD